MVFSIGILHTVFLSRETHRNSIGLSRVAKSYAFAIKLYSDSFYGIFYIQFFCLEKPIGLSLSCLEWPKPMLLAQNCQFNGF